MVSSFAMYQLIKKGYVQRIRTYKFIVILVLSVIFVYLFIPGPDATYKTFAIGNFKGIYNDIFLGVMTAIGTSLLVSLFAFFIINNSIENDDNNHIGEIIASTPLKNYWYMIGQALSNFAVLLTILGTIISTTLIIFIFRQQKAGIQIIDFLLPFILICIPILFVISALGVIFETFFMSKNIVMIILYYGLYSMFLVFLMNYLTTPSIGNNMLYSFLDPFGILFVIRLIQNTILLQYPSANVYNIAIGFTYSVKPASVPQQYLLTNINWQGAYILSRIFWIGLMILLTLLASKFFKRFDPAREGFHLNNKKIKENVQNSIEQYISVNTNEQSPQVISLGSLAKLPRKPNFIDFSISELKVEVKNRPLWWKILVIIFFLGSFSISSSTFIFWSLAWVCLLPVLSSIGSRESVNDTYQIIFSSPNPTKQFFFKLFTYFIFLLAFNGIIILNFAFQNEFEHSIALISGIMFVISLAGFLGEFTKSKKLYELLFLLLYYIGPINGIPYFDFIGVTAEAINLHIWIVYLVFSVVLIVLSILKRNSLNRF